MPTTDELLAKYLDDRDAMTRAELADLRQAVEAQPDLAAELRSLLLLDELLAQHTHRGQRGDFAAQMAQRLRDEQRVSVPQTVPFVAPRRRRHLAAAAALAVAIGVGWWLLRTPQSVPNPRPLAGAVVETQRRPRRIGFGPHVSVELAADTKMVVAESAPPKLKLLRGRLDCEVEPGRADLTIVTQLGEARVAGTRFSVTFTPMPAEKENEPMMKRIATMTVAVAAGTVLVTPAGAGEAQALQAGQSRMVFAEADSSTPAKTLDINTLHGAKFVQINEAGSVVLDLPKAVDDQQARPRTYTRTVIEIAPGRAEAVAQHAAELEAGQLCRVKYISERIEDEDAPRGFRLRRLVYGLEVYDDQTR